MATRPPPMRQSLEGSPLTRLDRPVHAHPEPEVEAARSPRLVEAGRSVVLRIAWIVCAVLLSLGSAGIIAGIDHQPGSAARAELTWAADEAIEPGLIAAAGDLDRLSTEVDKLATLGTEALTSLVGRDLVALDTSIQNGQDLITRIEADTDALRTRLAELPAADAGAEGRLSGEARRRYAGLVGALDATAGLRDSWTKLTTGSVAAIKLTKLLALHDQQTADAARTGTKGDYAGALAKLALSDATIAQTKKLRDDLSATVDVTILTMWIDRNAAYDKALRSLYVAVRSSRGKATPAVKRAIAAQQAALAQLPPDTRGLVLIMADVAQGGLNQAVITIEVARKRLSDASAALSASPSPQPSAAANP